MTTMFEVGDRVRLNVPTISGWQGNGTVTRAYGETVEIKKDNEVFDDTCEVCPHELTKLQGEADKLC